MFVAQIRNKLTRQEEQMEDLLTSNVFGLWRYIAPELGLIQFLETACRLDGQHISLPSHIAEVKLDFWPWLHESTSRGAEPDVFISLIDSDGQKSLILIEAKYLSGKSSEATKEGLPNDQLAREMHNLRMIAKRQAIDAYALVYVTAHAGLPSNDFKEAINELEEKTGEASYNHFYWTSWRNIPQILGEVMPSARSPIEKALLQDLGIILNQLGLTYFRGITSQGWNLGDSWQWSFERPHAAFDWSSWSLPIFKFQTTSTKFVWSREDSQPKALWRWPID